MRAVLELAGIHDILSKSLGTQNPINLVKATVAGLQDLRTPEEVAELRGLSIDRGPRASTTEPGDGRRAQLGRPTTPWPRRRGRAPRPAAEEAEAAEASA